MRSSRNTVVVALVCLGAVAAVPVQAWAAGSGTGATSYGTVAYTVPDIQFDGPDCIEVPVTYTFTKTVADPTDVSLRASLQMAQAGSSSSIDTSKYFGYFDGASGTLTSDLYVCPYAYEPAAGSFAVTGVLEGEFDLSSKQQAALSGVTVNVIQNPVKMSVPKLTKDSGFYTLKGTAVANAPSKGAIGADGTIVISIRKPGSKRWIKGTTTSPDSFGRWEAYLSDSVRKGYLVRADLVDCRWCSNASKTIKVTR